MNYYYCETCEMKLKESELLEHAMYCFNFTRIEQQDYEENIEVES